MQRFVLGCLRDEFRSSSVVHLEGPAEQWPGLRAATEELAEHVIAVHGEPAEGDTFAFKAIEWPEIELN